MADLKNKPVTINGKRLNNLNDKLAFVRDTLIKNGFPLVSLQNSITQVMLESAWLTSNIAAKDTNLTGIKLSKAESNIAFQKSLGVKQGSRAGYNEGNYHANYPNIDAWAKDYKRLLSTNSKPINEADPNAFIEKLYQNNYFTSAGYTAYKSGFIPTLSGIKAALINMVTPTNNSLKNGVAPILIISALLFGLSRAMS